MAIGDETRDLSTNLGTTRDNALEVKETVTSARETAQDVENILGVFEDIANRSDDVEDTLHGFSRLMKLVGKVPFAEGDVAYHHRHTPAPDPRERNDAIPEAMAQLILDLMAKDPDERPATAAAVRERLQVFLEAERTRS